MGADSIFKLFDFPLKVSFSGMHLALMLVHVPLNVLFGLGFGLLDLSKELLLLEGYPFPFKFDFLKFLPIFLRQLIVLALSVLELLCLHLVFLIDCHDRLEISLHPLEVLDELSIL
jgi:hypothetical protein